MAKRNVYEVSDLIQYSIDKKYYKDWNKACNLFDNNIDVWHEVTMRTFDIGELDDVDGEPEYDKKFCQILLEFMKDEDIEEVSFTR